MAPSMPCMAISFAVLPIRRHAFFEQTVLQGQIGDHLLERRGLTPKIVDLVRGGGPGYIASQADPAIVPRRSVRATATCR